MNTLWKIGMGVAAVLPVAGYVAGVVTASGGSDLQPRDTIIVEQSGSNAPADDRREDDKGHGKENARKRISDDDDSVEVVEAEPDDVTDGDAGQTRTRTRTGHDGADDHGGGINSGPGSVTSGHGGDDRGGDDRGGDDRGGDDRGGDDRGGSSGSGGGDDSRGGDD